ncbi:rod-determining factor RdfA [Halorubrum vacuolatum]|uniref:Uncharacterized protein n=1 Tax=Halorubrum vacuolatum TaxID=63740 RepID=A0A238Y575_HALVU|nr:rod-determining factor RdfA [Halorubrum vacuolatum]SNR66355.1 hypothetical protein SAMN06264855_1312 [Halorubrum vacuolatum]
MSNRSSGRRTKVARLIEEYDLAGMGAQLEEAWTGTAGERTSLRDLADEFNQAVLEAALRDADVSGLSVDVVGTYEALNGGSGAERTRAERRLEREGVDPDALSKDFVTHQAVHTYLTKDRGASLPEDETDPVDRKINTIEKLQGRTVAVTESALSSLTSAGALDNKEYDVLIDIRAVCPACGSSYPVRELLRSGGCDCS